MLGVVFGVEMWRYNGGRTVDEALLAEGERV